VLALRGNGRESPFRPAQVAQQPALEPEIEAQPLGNREHKLPVRHFGANVLGQLVTLGFLRLVAARG